METSNQSDRSEDHSPKAKRMRSDPRLEYTSEKIGLSIIIDPKHKYNKPKSNTRHLPANKYMFTFTNNNYSREEIEDLLKNNRILIRPEDIHTTQLEEYRPYTRMNNISPDRTLKYRQIQQN